MGLGGMLTRAMKWDVTDTKTGAHQTFTISDPLSPSWAQRGDYRGALSLPGAWKCAKLLSDLLGGIPWDVLEESSTGRRREVESPLMRQPCPPDTRISTISSMALDLLHHGNAIAVYTAWDELGTPTAMLPVPAESVFVWRHREGDQGVPPDTVPGEIVYEIGGRRFKPRDVLHVKGPCRPGALRGMGVLEAHLNTVGLASLQQEFARDMGSAAVPTGVLKSENPDLTAPEADAMKARFMESQRRRTVAVLNATTSYVATAWNPTELQLLEARKFSLHELGLIYDVPLSFLGVETGSLTYSTAETEALNLIKFSLGGHLARFEQAIALALPPGQTPRANLDALLRSDTLTRYQAHEIALRAKFLTVDEVRELEDRPPLTEAQKEQLTALGTPAPIEAGDPDADDPDEADATEPDDEDEGERAAWEWVRAKKGGDPEALAHYWKRGPGRKKWVGTAHPWTNLYKHLRKHVTPPSRAKRIAAQWFKDVFGIWPGERKGKNPTGPG